MRSKTIFHFIGSQLCLCDHTDGSILVYGGSSISCNSSVACRPLPHVWHYAIQSGKMVSALAKDKNAMKGTYPLGKSKYLL